MKKYEHILDSIYNMGERAGIKTKKGAWKFIAATSLVVAILIFGIAMLIRGFRSGVRKG